jgi:hypothetical protein
MEQRDQGDIGGAIQGGVVYASPDFPDVEPLDIRNQNAVSTVVSNVILFHVSDAVEKQNQHKIWKRKIREILQNHQEKILQFFIKPISEDHPLRHAHILMTKYGKYIHNEASRQTPQFFKDYITECPQTGSDQLNQYLFELSEMRSSDTQVQKWMITLLR